MLCACGHEIIGDHTVKVGTVIKVRCKRCDCRCIERAYLPNELNFVRNLDKKFVEEENWLD